MSEDAVPATPDTLADRIEAALVNAFALKERIGRGEGGRELALTITKLEEAGLWLGAMRANVDTPPQ